MMTNKNQPTTWTPRNIAFLLYFKNEYVTEYDQILSFGFISDLMGREIGFHTTKNACISAYRKFGDRGALYGKELIKDYLVGMDVVY